MAHRTRAVPLEVHQAAQTAWSKWHDKIEAIPPTVKTPTGYAYRAPNAHAELTPQERMIAKIKRRMNEYPEYYETDPQRVACTVTCHLERIGGILERNLPNLEGAVTVWHIPLSVFNYLVDGDEGETFVHGALSAWSSAEIFNEANHADLSAEQCDKLRATFLEDAPLLLKAVLEEMLKTDLKISFAKEFVGPELKNLVMQVRRPG